MKLGRKTKRLINATLRKSGALGVMLIFSYLLLVWKSHQGDNNNVTELQKAPGLPTVAAPNPEPTPKSLHQIMAQQYDVPYGLHEGKSYKKILYWNSARSLPLGSENNNFGLGVGRDRYKSAGCPVWQCETSEDRSDLLQYDAIIFNQRTFNASDLPKERSPRQRYIFFSHETPAYQVENTCQGENETFAAMAGFFNWTMTYRLDSDIVHPYGWFDPINTSSSKQLDVNNYATGKTKMAAFFSSNCLSVSGREETVYELMENNIQVDLYGDCGNLTCGSLYYNKSAGGADESCWEMVSKKYKFMLVFYNSLCLDYITERFYDAIRFPIIPVVMDPHGSHAKVAPPHSFINVLDFLSIRHLADYLIKLDKNDTLYNEYFWWKKHYRIRNAELYSGIHYRTYCSLCAVLHDPGPRPDFQVYYDMKSWWVEKSECKAMYFGGVYASEDPNDPFM